MRLQHAVLLGEEAAAEAAAAAGGDVNSVTQGLALLHVTAAFGHVACMDVLLRAGADPNVVNSSGRTPLHCLTPLKDPEAAEACAAALLAGGADPNATDRQQYTPLHYTAMKGSEGATAVLLAAGADPAARAAGRGDVAAHLAATQGHAGILRLLVQADPSVALLEAGAGVTPLAAAVVSGHVEAASFLLEEAPLPRGSPAGVLGAFAGAASDDMRRLIPVLVSRLPLTQREWQVVPTPCAGLLAALPAVLQRSTAEAAELVSRLPPVGSTRLRCFALCLARLQCRHGVSLPAPLAWRLPAAVATHAEVPGPA